MTARTYAEPARPIDLYIGIATGFVRHGAASALEIADLLDAAPATSTIAVAIFAGAPERDRVYVRDPESGGWVVPEYAEPCRGPVFRAPAEYLGALDATPAERWAEYRGENLRMRWEARKRRALTVSTRLRALPALPWSAAVVAAALAANGGAATGGELATAFAVIGRAEVEELRGDLIVLRDRRLVVGQGGREEGASTWRIV